jgi:hypothetical protein
MPACLKIARVPAVGAIIAAYLKPVARYAAQPAAVFGLARNHPFLAANDKTNLTPRCFKLMLPS